MGIPPYDDYDWDDEDAEIEFELEIIDPSTEDY